MKAPTIKSTKDYSKFNFLKWNRQLNASNLSKLEKENSKRFQMHLFPIVVDKKFNIIDGQHRFQVCMANNWEVFYLQDKDKLNSVEDYYEKIRSVNAVGRQHTSQEKFLMLLQTGDKNAKFIWDIYQYYGGAYSLSTVLTTLCKNGNGNSLKMYLDNRRLILVEDEYGRELLYKVNKSSILGKNRRLFVLQLQLICKRHQLKVSEMLSKLEDWSLEVKPRMSKEVITERILSIWNKGRHLHNRIPL